MASRRQRILVAVRDLFQSTLGIEVGRYLVKVRAYNGEIDQSQGPDDMRRLLEGCAPGILIAPLDGTFTSESITRRKFRHSVTVEIYVVSNHSGSHEDRLLSDVVADGNPAADPGIWQMAEDTFNLLAGEDLGIEELGPLLPQRESVLFQVPDMTVWRLTYEARLTVCKEPISGAGPPLTSYEINGNLVDTDGETVLPEPPNPFVEADGDPTTG